MELRGAGGEAREGELEEAEAVADAVRVVGGDGVHAAGDRRVDRVGGVDGPGADGHSELVRTGDPVGTGGGGVVRIQEVDARDAVGMDKIGVARRDALDLEAGELRGEMFAGGVAEGDEHDPVGGEQAVAADGLDREVGEAAGGRVASLLLDLEDEHRRLRARALRKVFVERGEALAVRKNEVRDVRVGLQPDVRAADLVVVPDDEPLVERHVHVELRAPEPGLLRGGQRGEGVLGADAGRPVPAAVRDDGDAAVRRGGRDGRRKEQPGDRRGG